MCTCARGRIRNCIVHARLVTDGSGYHFLCIYIDRIILVDMERRSVGVLCECGRALGVWACFWSMGVLSEYGRGVGVRACCGSAGVLWECGRALGVWACFWSMGVLSEYGGAF